MQGEIGSRDLEGQNDPKSCGFGVWECLGYRILHDGVKFYMLGGEGGGRLANGYEYRIGRATFVGLS